MPTLTQSIDRESAQGSATHFLMDHMGNQVVAGQPMLMISALRALWIVPVQLTYLHTGSLGDVGVVAVDGETGQVVGWTPLADMKRACRALRQAHKPEITEQFATFLTSQKETPPS